MDSAVGTYRLTDRYVRRHGAAFMTGVQALVRVVINQIVRDAENESRAAALISGYQGSPLGVLDLELHRNVELLRAHDIVHQPAVNEELAATALMGSQLVGVAGKPRFDRVVGMWYGKAPGLDRAADAIRHANHVGCPPTGGVLAVVGDDAAAKSSTLPSASEATLAALHLPVLHPADPEDVLRLGRHGYAMSRAAGLWVGCKISTSVADGSQSVPLDDLNQVRPVSLEVDGRPYVHQPSATLAGKSTLDLEYSLFYLRLEIVRRYIRENRLNRIVVGGPQDRIGIVSAGKTWLDVRQALFGMGLDDSQLRRHGIRLIKLDAIYPLDRTGVREFSQGLTCLIVVEEKGSFMEAQIRDLLYPDANRPAVVGKFDNEGGILFPANGDLDADAVALALARVLGSHGSIPALEAWREHHVKGAAPADGEQALIVRTPFFCSGCPHNRSVKVPDGALVGGGIGCHGMAVLMKPAQVGNIMGLTQMGGEGAQWVGMAPFTEQHHVFQNLGDGTYFHSGSLAVRAAVASGANVTYKLLYNSAVAMTGGQKVVGSRSVADISRMLLAEGVRRVIITSEDPPRTKASGLPAETEVWHRDRLLEAQEVLARISGVTVLIHDQECAAEKRRKRKRGRAEEPARRIAVNPRLCEGCGDCGMKSNCLSVQTVDTEFGLKAHIHQASCNKDYSCIDGDCPSFVSVLPPTASSRVHRGARDGRPKQGPGCANRPGLEELGPADLPPPLVQPHDRWAVRLLGVGGTGVVTAAQVLATAATLEGRYVRGSDQTGLSQKAGPVISDLSVTEAPADGAHKLARGTCDLYLACDLVVGADPNFLVVADPARTAMVASTALVPTGDMVGNPRLRSPDRDRLLEALKGKANPVKSVYLDAHRVCEVLFGGNEFVNTFLIGVALQQGLLPIGSESIEEAFRINGVAVGTNIQAFRRGRQFVADRSAFESAAGATSGASTGAHSPWAGSNDELSGLARIICGELALPEEGELAALVRRRTADLIRYQSTQYAREYAGFVARVHRVEQSKVPGQDRLSVTVARYLYKFMAYKDEYEVASLSIDPETVAYIRSEFDPASRYSILLHPPIMRSLGLQRKIELQRTAKPLFQLLRSMRRLRGTPLDPFGYTQVRKVERQLINEYRTLISDALGALAPDTHETAIALASLPDVVRGYEEIKLASVEEFRGRAASLRAELHGISKEHGLVFT
jgi:indolepyruvate ferredoxin oxidoreductase